MKLRWSFRAANDRAQQSESHKVSAAASVGASVLCTEVSTGHPHPVIRTKAQ
jgi:hypothetical protein